MLERGRDDLVLADLTFGAGGHSLALAGDQRCKKLYAFDQDPEAIANGRLRIDQAGLIEKIELIHANFSQIDEVITPPTELDGVLIDLGVSSHQFDSGERGFSFRFDAPLDMRMNPSDKTIETARQILATRSAGELEQIFRDYGEEKFARRIAERVVEVRTESEIETTGQLEDLVFHCYPKSERFSGKKPATKVFQALRIAVNRELDVLVDVIDRALPLLSMGGRLAIISFHSLEDRIVKQQFKKAEQRTDLLFEIQTKKPIVPTESEIFENNRARSAKLRVIQRVDRKRSKNKYPAGSVKE